MALDISSYSPLHLPARHKITSERKVEVHMLTCHAHADLAVWALLSWSLIGGRSDKICIHDDGSLSQDDYDRFLSLCPGSRIISPIDADERAKSYLLKFPHCQTFRRETRLSMKLFDFFFFAETSKIIILDSDVLTFDYITSIEYALGRRENTFLEDYQYAFCMTKSEFCHLAPHSAYKRINSGLGVVDTSCLNLDLIEHTLSLVRYQPKIWWAEQTLFALISAELGVELFDNSYRVAQGPGLEALKVKHYVWSTRPLAYSEGIPAVKRALRHRLDGK
jgi:hypothetical protein